MLQDQGNGRRGRPGVVWVIPRSLALLLSMLSAVLFASAQKAGGIDWSYSTAEATQQAQATARPVFVMFADERAFTTRLDRTLAANDDLRRMITDRCVPLRLRFTRKNLASDVKQELRAFGVRGFPALGLITKRGVRVADRVAGAVPAAKIEAWLSRVLPLCDRFDAQAAYQAKRYGDARALFAPFAEQGDPLALTFVGKMCLEGWGGDVDPKRGVALLERAISEHDYVDAKRVLGECYVYGRGVKGDYARAYALCRAAEFAGHPKALAAILDLVRRGYEPTDGRSVRTWFERAALLTRNPEIMLELGERLLAPAEMAESPVDGVKRRLAGRTWVVHAAVFGSSKAMARLKAMVAQDEQAEASLIMAYLRMEKPPVDMTEIKRMIERRFPSDSPLKAACLARYYAKPGPEHDVGKARKLLNGRLDRDAPALAHAIIAHTHDEDKRKASVMLHGLVAWLGAGAAEAFWRIDDLARRGDRAAQVTVASLHGLKTQAALHAPHHQRYWLEAAWRGGSREAGTPLAELEIAARRIERAEEILRQARVRGSKTAVATLGRVLALHDTRDAARREGFALLVDAARQGLPGAAIDLARCHLRGVVGKPDAAWAWARLVPLGKRMRMVQGVGRLQEDVFLAKRPSRAATILRAVLEAYGRMFHGTTGTVDATIAVWAANGDADAAWAQGHLHLAARRPRDALSSWRAAMHAGHAGAAFELAQRLMTEADAAAPRIAKLAAGAELRRAASLAARVSYPGAKTLLGDVVARGVDTKPDPDAAARHYYAALTDATAPDPAAVERLFALWKKTKRPIPTLLMCRSQYSAESTPKQRRTFLRATYRSLQRSPSTALAEETVAWLRTIAPQDAYAALILYLIHRSEKLAPNPAAAVAWIRRAVDGGEVAAFAHLASLHRDGLVVRGKTLVKKNVGEAERLYRSSIEAGAGGMGGLALVLYKQKRREELYDYALPMAKKGDPEAMLGLSMVYVRSPKENGGGPARDLIASYAWAHAANLIAKGGHRRQLAELKPMLDTKQIAAAEKRGRALADRYGRRTK